MLKNYIISMKKSSYKIFFITEKYLFMCFGYEKLIKIYKQIEFSYNCNLKNCSLI